MTPVGILLAGVGLVVALLAIAFARARDVLDNAPVRCSVCGRYGCAGRTTWARQRHHAQEGGR